MEIVQPKNKPKKQRPGFSNSNKGKTQDENSALWVYPNARRPVVHLIDGNNWVNRAFYASAEMSTSTGIPTNAVKAFSNMLWKLIRTYEEADIPLYMAVAFDIAKKQTFRADIFNAWVKRDRELVEALLPPKKDTTYKGGRDKNKDKEMMENLGEQMKICQEVVAAAGIPTFNGYKIDQMVEADDIIGTLSRLPNCLALIHSRDKDFAQLLRKACRIYVPAQANSPAELLTVDNCYQKYGIKPSQFVEYLMLNGDKVDNIPGVPGCGEKTAIKLLDRYDSISGIEKYYAKVEGRERGAAYAIAGKPVPAKKRGDPDKETIRPDFDVTRKLAKIKTNVKNLPRSYKELALAKPDMKRLKAMKKELEFSHLFWA